MKTTHNSMNAHRHHGPFTTAWMKLGLSSILLAGIVMAPGTAAREVQYEYDDLSRVTRVTYDSCTTVEYDYDAAGNITATRTLVDNSADTDCDNVANAGDACPATPDGAIVNAQGCTVEQGCPCAGPLSGGNWANHGEYVSCVIGVADQLLGLGAITSGDRNVIIGNATASSCGDPNNAPNLAADTASTDACHAVVVDVLANDSDIEDGAGSNLSITNVSGASFGTAVVIDDGGIDKILYTPNTGVAGTENLVYAAQDSGGASTNGSLVITVNATVDSDGDGVMDSCDNCLATTNTDQRDTNGDGFGNACDADVDNNGVVEFIDLNRLKLAFFTNVGDPGYDPDLDFDGVDGISFTDLNLMKLTFFQAPGPSGIAP